MNTNTETEVGNLNPGTRTGEFTYMSMVGLAFTVAECIFQLFPVCLSID